MDKKFNQRGAISAGIAVLILVTSLIGVIAGYKAVQKPTNIAPKAQIDQCTTIERVEADKSTVALNENFNCKITISEGGSRYLNVCGIQKAGTNDWPQDICNNASVGAGNWSGNTVSIPCNSSRTADYVGQGGNFQLVAFSNQPDCLPGGNPANATGKKTSAQFTIGTAAQSTPVPTQGGGGGTDGSGKCLYLIVELNKTDAGDFDAWVTFNIAPNQQRGAEIQLFRNGTHVARTRPWVPPFTYWPQYTGGRIAAGQTVTFRGWTDSCGGRGTTEDIVTCQTNSDGTFIQTDRCKQRGGYAQPPPTQPPVPTPTSSGGAGGVVATNTPVPPTSSPTPTRTPTPTLKPYTPQSGEPVQQENFVQRVINNIPFIPKAQPTTEQKPTSISGKVKVSNTTGVQVEAVFVTLHADQNDRVGISSVPVQNETYNFDGLEDKPYVIKAWARTADGNWYQNKSCTATGDDYDCSVKPGEKKNLEVDIGAQGLRAFYIKTREISQNAFQTVGNFVINIPVVGPLIYMSVISGFL